MRALISHQTLYRSGMRAYSSTAARRAMGTLHKQKAEGTIEDIFTSFTKPAPPLPQRFSDLKREIAGKDVDRLVESWRDVLQELEVVTAEVAARGGDNIPQIPYQSVVNGLSARELEDVKRTGVVIVKGGVPADEALAWKQSIRDYAALNKDHVKGSPADNIVFYEIYQSPAQIAARSHPALINTQRFLLNLWNSSSPDAPVSMSTPITYFDRLRIRPPGPSAFTLGCHIDGGGLERWEDEGYRKCYEKVFEGGKKWREMNQFDVAPRMNANQDLYNAPNQCSVFRPWQGWTSLSSTGAGEGTLRVLPFLRLATAYIMLRPFFRVREQATRSASDSVTPLGFNDWEPNFEGTEFPGSEPGKAQILNEDTHPHLKLQTTVTSIPRVEPGDQVYWHCDLVHAVESQHTGKGDSSVLYIPAVPLTMRNGGYLRAQYLNFVKGLPPPDFPGGEGESKFKGRGMPEDVKGLEAKRLFGIEPYEVPADATPGTREAIENANMIIF